MCTVQVSQLMTILSRFIALIYLFAIVSKRSVIWTFESLSFESLKFREQLVFARNAALAHSVIGNLIKRSANHVQASFSQSFSSVTPKIVIDLQLLQFEVHVGVSFQWARGNSWSTLTSFLTQLHPPTSRRNVLYHPPCPFHHRHGNPNLFSATP